MNKKNIVSDKWEKITLGEVCSVVNGGTPKTNVSRYWGGQHAWITPAEMGKLESPFVEKTRRTLTDDGLDKCSASLLPAQSVILSSRAPIGYLVINKIPMATNQGCRGLIPCDQLHYKFLYYFLVSNVRLLDDLGAGTTFKELSATKLKGVFIPFPPLSEQKKIVAILDEAFTAIETATANTKKNLANAKELFESQLDQVFGDNAVTSGWNKIPLEDLCEFRNGLWKGKKPPYVHVGVIRNTNFTKSCTLNDDNIAYLDVEESKFANRQLQFGDLILERSGGGPNQPVGRVVTFEKTEGLFSFSNFTSVIRVADPLKLSFQFLYRALCWYYFSGATEGMQHRSTGIRNLNFTTYKQLQIPFPPIVKQKRIATTLDKAFVASENLTQIGKQKLAHLADLKQSILHKAFSGELTADSKATNL